MDYKSVKIIAECGVNHNGNMDLAKDMIHVAHESGADYVKFQTYKTDKLIKHDCPMADYQLENLKEKKSQSDMLKKYELSEDNFLELIAYAKKVGINFISTPFDMDSLDFLCRQNLDFLKISSGDLTNAPLLMKAAQNNKNLVLSTGMSEISEIYEALAVLYWGYSSDKQPQSSQDIFDCLPNDFYKSLLGKVKLLHCVSDYPAPVSNINLSAMKTLENLYGLEVGYSDHTLGIHISCAAVALGATVIEKHFTLDRNLPGPDHKASLLPEELKDMINCIRDIEKSIGDGVKIPRGNEHSISKLVRKGVYANQHISKGQTIKPEDIICMRPETENPPIAFWDLVNKKSDKTYKPGDIL